MKYTITRKNGIDIAFVPSSKKANTIHIRASNTVNVSATVEAVKADLIAAGHSVTSRSR